MKVGKKALTSLDPINLIKKSTVVTLDLWKK